jgi:hypothetical protein
LINKKSWGSSGFWALERPLMSRMVPREVGQQAEER